MTVLFIEWILLGSVVLGLVSIKTPPDTEYGRDNPAEAWAAWTLMISVWPLTLYHRKKFARFSDPRDDDNPSWLAETRRQ